jgi:hypothetical protein
MQEVNTQRVKEKEELESSFAIEMDSKSAQHRRALQQLRVCAHVNRSVKKDYNYPCKCIMTNEHYISFAIGTT